MGLILGLFSSKATWVVVVAALVVAALGFQHVRISHLKNQVVDREEQIKIAKAELQNAKDVLTRWSKAYDSLALTVKEQNDQIAALETEVKVRIEKARAALIAAAKSREEAESLSRTMTEMELSKDECTALQQLVDTARAGGLQ